MRYLSGLFRCLDRNKTIACLIFSVFFQISVAYADQLLGKVVGVADGDTVTVLDADKKEYKVRLAGIDAPEKKQPFGQTSKQHLSDMVYGKHVVVEWRKRDKYSRIVGKVVIDGNDACLKQVSSGLAWHYKQYAGEQSAEDRKAYSNAEVSARSSKVGLWKDENPLPPWEYRHH
jgi:endonuclease YncB( thermonuclease family)